MLSDTEQDLATGKLRVPVPSSSCLPKLGINLKRSPSLGQAQPRNILPAACNCSQQTLAGGARPGAWKQRSCLGRGQVGKVLSGPRNAAAPRSNSDKSLLIAGIKQRFLHSSFYSPISIKAQPAKPLLLPAQAVMIWSTPC